jgi:hypothetical protein
MDKAERESVSSMNALVRELIRSGVSWPVVVVIIFFAKAR